MNIHQRYPVFFSKYCVVRRAALGPPSRWRLLGGPRSRTPYMIVYHIMLHLLSSAYPRTAIAVSLTPFSNTPNRPRHSGVATVWVAGCWAGGEHRIALLFLPLAISALFQQSWWTMIVRTWPKISNARKIFQVFNSRLYLGQFQLSPCTAAHAFARVY